MIGVIIINELYNTTEKKAERAVLAAADFGEYDVERSLDELEELAKTAGAEVVGRLTQRRDTPEAGTFLGSGRLQELADFCEANNVDTVIFDHELTGTQLKNIEDIVKLPVIDRTMLILDIFAARAHTMEGKLQVELAQQRYRLPRLMGMGRVLSRLGGGIGTRGPGETKLESDRRHIRRRIDALSAQLKEVSGRREGLREKRKRDGIPTAVLMGYTNVGKSTILNLLTGADVLAENKLFATLDPTSRGITLPDGRNLIIIDTVGLISRLPHHLVEAFRSTLSEVEYADLIVKVADFSEDLSNQLETTDALIADLKVTAPCVTVFNKCDRVELIPENSHDTAYISAKTGMGIDKLIEILAYNLPSASKRLTVLLPYTVSEGLLNEVRENGVVYSADYLPEGVKSDCLVEERLLHKFTGYVVT